MVTHINFAVDDNVAERAKQIKQDLGLSWPEYMEQANECLEERVQ